MNNLIYHNNFHRSNHHTVSSFGYPESASDPIASLEFPFIGTFYNDYYDIAENYIGSSNSIEWWNARTITNSNSATWQKYLTTYTTVCANSANWDLGYNGYLTMNSLSSKWESTFQTMCANLEYWNAVYDPYTAFTNKVQEFTKQKTSKNFQLVPDNINHIVWDLEVGQVATYVANSNSYFSDFTGAKKGGIYNLIVIGGTDGIFTFGNNQRIYFFENGEIERFGVGVYSYQIEFGSKFKFPNFENTYTIEGSFLRKFQFIYDGKFLHGRSNLYDISFLYNSPLVKFGSFFQIQKFGGEKLYIF